MTFSNTGRWIVSAIFAAAVMTCALDVRAEEKDTPTESGADAVAIVNGEKISRTDYERAVSEMERRARRPGRHPMAPQPTGLEKEALDSLIEMELFHQAAVKSGVTVDENELNRHYEMLVKRFPSQNAFDEWLKNRDFTEEQVKSLMRRGIAVRNFTQRELIKHIEVSEEETRAYFDSHKAAFKQPQQIKASHILIKVDPKADEAQKAEARKKIEDIRKRLEKGEDFAALASEFSEGPSKDKGGDLGYFQKGQMVKPFEEAAFALKKGEVSDVVETQFGYHLIKVFDIRPERELAYEEVKSRIELMLKQQKLKKEKDAYSAKLREEADIKILLPPEELADDKQ